jgi:RecA-family ATPase
MIGAERSSGKTRLCIHLAYTIACELDDFLGYKVKNHGNILLLNLELYERDLSCLLKQTEMHFLNNGYKLKHKIETFSYMDHLDTGYNEFNDLISNINPDVIIIDGFKMLSTIYCNHKNLKDISNIETKDFIVSMRSWMEVNTNCTILLTNHTNKGTSQEATHGDILYGPGALQDYFDQVSMIRKTKNDNERLIIPTKNRFSDEAESSINLFQIRSDEITQSVWPELIEADVNEKDHRSGNKTLYTKEQKLQAKALFEAGKSYSQIAEVIGGPGMSKGTIAKWKLNGWK